MSHPNTEMLFRREAIAALSRDRSGRPLAVMPPAWRWLTGLSFLFVATAVVFVSFAEYARRETVRGWLVAEDGAFRIAAAHAAVVERIVVRPGSLVNAGDPLVYLTRQTQREDGSGSAEAALDRIRVDLAAVASRKRLATESADSAVAAVDAQLEHIAIEIRYLVEQKEQQEQHLEVARARFERIRQAAAAGAVAAWEVMSQEDGLIARHLRMGELREREQRLRRERDSLRQQRVQHSVALRQKLAALEAEAGELQREMARYDEQRVHVLRAPASGRVGSVTVTRGAAVRASQLLLTLLRDEASLLAEVYVPSRAIGFVSEGQPVRLRYDAFPLHAGGVATGTVKSIDNYILLPRDLPAAFATSEPTYTLRIALHASSVRVGDEDRSLRPGMLLAAEIILERRTIAAWLLASLWRRAPA